jgi:hypothetical protein
MSSASLSDQRGDHDPIRMAAPTSPTTPSRHGRQITTERVIEGSAFLRAGRRS